MAHVDPRTRPVPEELVALVRDCVKRRGLRGASNVLGLSRATLTAVLVGMPTMAGTIAILRLAQQRNARPVASATRASAT